MERGGGARPRRARPRRPRRARGAPRFFKAAKARGIRPIVGAELTLEGGGALPLLVETQRGYRNLCRLITRMKGGVPKGEGRSRLEMLRGLEPGSSRCPGWRRSASGAEPARHRPPGAARRELRARRVWLDVQRHRRREQEAANQAAARPRRRARRRRSSPPTTCATPRATRPRAARRAHLHARTKHDARPTPGACSPQNAERHLQVAAPRWRRCSATGPTRSAQHRGASPSAARSRSPTSATASPTTRCRRGETHASASCASSPTRARASATGPITTARARQLEHELALIEKLELAGYFLIVWDIVRFCRASAASSCRAAARPRTAPSATRSASPRSIRWAMELLFERFLSEERGEWPDIDLDLPIGRPARERSSSTSTQRYGARGAAMTANVITYRDAQRRARVGQGARLRRSSRSTGSPSCCAASSTSDPHDDAASAAARAAASIPRRPRIALLRASSCGEIQDLPRHLGQHSGGMVIAAGRLDDGGAARARDHARPRGRAVGQGRLRRPRASSRSTCSGLGMMAALEEAHPAGARRTRASTIDLAHLPPDDPEGLRACSSAPTPSASSRSRAARRWRRCRACSPSTSTTWWSRWRSSGPGPIVGQDGASRTCAGAPGASR